MAAIDFPTATSNGQTFEADSGVIYTYVGTPPNGFWSGTFGTTGLTTLDSRYIAKNDSNTIQTIQTQGLKFNNGSTDTILIDGLNSRIGIGTTSPLGTLHTSGNSADLVGAFLENRADAGSSDSVSLNFVLRRAGGFQFGIPAITAIKENAWTGTPSTINNSLVFSTIGNESSAERMRIDSSGNVGIGTTSPTKALEVAAGGTTSGGLLVTGSSSPQIRLEEATGVAGSIQSDATAVYVGTVSNHPLILRTNVAERARITSNGNVGIGTTSPQVNLDIAPASSSATLRVHARTNTSAVPAIELQRGTATTWGSDIYGDYRIKNDTSELIFEYGQSSSTTERARIDSSGRLLVGTSTTRLVGQVIPGLQLSGGVDASSVSLSTYANSINSSRLCFAKSRGTSDGSYTIVQSGDELGVIAFCGADGSDLESRGAEIAAIVDGTPGANDLPSRLVFSTAADGTSSPTERMRITSGGNIGINNSDPKYQMHVSSNSSDSSQRIDLHLTNDTTGHDSGDGVQFGYQNVLGAYIWNFEPTSTYFGTSNAERMRIDSSGRLLVGTSSVTGTASTATSILRGPASQGAYVYLCRNSAPGANNVLGSVTFADDQQYSAAFIAGFRDSSGTWTPGSSHPSRLAFATTADGASSPTERMRIGNAGNIVTFTNTTGAVDSSTSSAAGTTNTIFRGYYGATSITSAATLSFRVYSNGNVENTNNSYGAISDAKLKENIVDANSQWDDLKALQVRNYNFKKGQTHTQIGLVAQEVETVSPGLVSESPDRDAEGNDLGTVTKSVNYSVLYMKAVKALQEAMERIETLELPNKNPINIRQTTSLLNNPFITFLNSSGDTAGSIIQNGVNSVTYATSSDYRLKDNVVELTAAIPRLKQLAPKRFNFTAAADVTVDGFLAHEAQAVVPEAVTGSHNQVDGDGNPVMQGIDQSKLVPLLTAALQEAIGRIETLETRIAALEDS